MAAAVAVPVQGRIIKGKIKDAATGEEIIGARVMVKEMPSKAAVSGMDGSFNIDSEHRRFTLVCSYIGYKTAEVTVSDADTEVEIPLSGSAVELAGITVISQNRGHSEASCRLLEMEAASVKNVMSQKMMQLSPDVTVANVIQRMSGVTVERNSSGDGQYAILRGMDKRYNYTLVNGVKIPSPDNKNRFVPLDIFPSEMLDRLEVTKSLTVDMEGDGIGGAVNLVMKDAPSARQFTANLAMGYNSMYLDRDFMSFGWGAISSQSPDERYGTTSIGSKVSASDFSSDPLKVSMKTPLPDITAGMSYGDRFFGGRLGVMAAVNFTSTNRGRESRLEYRPGTTYNGTIYRNYSVHQNRLGAHVKLDFRINETNKLTWYNGYMDMAEADARDGHDDRDRTVRLRYNHQYIVNSTLGGEHFLAGGNLKIDWSAIASKAYSETPDYIKMEFEGGRIKSSDCAERRWEHNSDRDLAGQLNMEYKLEAGAAGTFRLKAGGLYRDKRRDSFCNYYMFNSASGSNWQNFSDIVFTPRREYGSIGGALNYDATEKTAAGYAMVKYQKGRWEANAGLRAEYTDQGYKLKFPTESNNPEGSQRYWDLLPSAHVKYNVHTNGYIRLSYAKAVNRPSFFEIAPYSIIGEDYKEEGNPDLEHAVADNFDLRYELFPKSSEQFMVGLFYKNIKNPIEYGLVTEGQDLKYKPMNFGNAKNFGVEVDIMKYFSWIGVKANYTYTHSSITTTKRRMNGNEIQRVDQKRPLFGQAAHVANVSLLLKNAKHGWEGQLSGTYTGKRLSDISSWYDDDIWERGFFQIDASVEKSFACGLTLYAKANNLLDTPILRFIQAGEHTVNVDTRRCDGNVVERESWSGRSLTVGLRYKL